MYNVTIKVGESALKKKFISILSICFVFIFMVMTFAGCSFVERDPAKYANQVIATIKIGDHSEKITRQEVLNWWQNPVGLSGYYYMYYFGNTMQESLEKTVDDVINYRIRVYEAKKNVTLDDNDIRNIKTSVYDTIYSTLESYEKTIKEEWNIKDDEEDETKEENEYLNEKKEFDYVIDRDENGKIKEDENGNPVRIEKEEKTYDEPVFSYEREDSLVRKEAWKRFITSRKGYAKDNGDPYKTDEDAFNWEYNRLYKLYEESLYITKYQENYTNNLPIDYQVAVDKYVEDYLAQYEKYAQTVTGDNAETENQKRLDAYISAMQSNNIGIYYHPTESTADFNRVVHILFKYTDEMKKEISDLKDKLESGEINQDLYDVKYSELTSLDRKWVKAGKDGEGKDILKSPNEIYAEINEKLAEVDNNSALTHEQKVQKRAEIFMDYVYKYSEDEGFFSTSKDYRYFGYVVNTGENKKDSMTKEFTEVSQSLAQDETYGISGGNMGAPVYHEDLGTSSSAYTGVHIVFNMGKVEDYFGYDAAKNKTLTWKDLASKETMPGSGVTLLDYIYNKQNTDSKKLSNKIDEIKTETKKIAEIETYLKRLKDLYK